MTLPLLAAWYCVASVVTLVVYGVDKRAAQRGSRRVPEGMLHAMALLGGWPGALVAQRLFHHKTLKTLSARVLADHRAQLRWRRLDVAHHDPLTRHFLLTASVDP